jgi:hypothetical protein
MEPEWVEALKLLNKLTVGAPLASVLADEDYIEVDPHAFKLGTEGAPLKSKMASYYDDASFGEKGRKFIDMVSEIPSLAALALGLWGFGCCFFAGLATGNWHQVALSGETQDARRTSDMHARRARGGTARGARQPPRAACRVACSRVIGNRC